MLNNDYTPPNTPRKLIRRMESALVKRVCIIGAGVSGLVALKSCLEENLYAICYEKTDTTGGLWRYRSEDVDGLASIMKSTIMNTSKEMSAFSDFPPPDEFPNYMTNATVLSYLQKYVQQFDLEPHIRFHHEILQVKRHKQFSNNGKWIVKISQPLEEDEEEVFDYVMVCTGHHVFPHIPQFPGLDTFKGNVIHTRSLKVPHPFEDQRVLVIGIGSSGADAAVDISGIAKQVYLSTRRGSWVCARVGKRGLPTDVSILTRFNHCLTQYLPWNLVNSYAEYKVNQRFNHSLYCLTPEHRFFAQHLMVCDDLPNRILSGRVIVKPDIDHFTETEVVFVGGAKCEIDAIVLATGYDIRFPFLEDEVLPIQENSVSLYKFVFPPLLEQPTLGIIGLFQPFGSIFPVAEIQCRWVTRVFKKLCYLPSSAAMLEDIRVKEEDIRKKYISSPRHTIQVDFISYMNEVASQFGAVPDWLHLLFTDPQLLSACIFGPCVPYQYRLNGPNRWEGAPAAILNVKKRIIKALQTCDIGKRKNKYRDEANLPSLSTLFLLVFVAILFMLILVRYG